MKSEGLPPTRPPALRAPAADHPQSFRSAPGRRAKTGGGWVVGGLRLRIPCWAAALAEPSGCVGHEIRG